jgi:hypothetical protein
MAISFDAASSSGYQTAQTTYTWNHTNGGSDDILLVGVSIGKIGGADSVSSITYDGISLTLVGARSTTAPGLRSELWKLEDPPTGASLPIVVTLGGASDSVGSGVSLSNVVTSSATEAENDNQGTQVGTVTATVTITTVTDNAWVVSVVTMDDPPMTSTNTERTNVSGALIVGGMSTAGPVHPAGAQVMSWNGTGSTGDWAIVGVGVKPLVADTLQAQIIL